MVNQIETNLTSEQINKIDLFILNILKEWLLEQNLDFIDVMDYFNDQVIIDLNCSKEIFQRRTMYNFWLWYLNLIEINNEIVEDENFLNETKKKCKKRKIDFENIFLFLDNWNKILVKKIYYSNFLEAKITAEWLRYIEILEKQLKEMKWFWFIANKFKHFWEIFLKMKVAVWVWLTVLCVIIIFAFDIKISKFISKIPLLSSVIDTSILETFEEVNKNDEFYKSMKTVIDNPRVNLNQKENIKFGESPSILLEQQDISTVWQTIRDIKVKNVSTNEKIFKIDLENWKQKFVTVIKDVYWKFQVRE